MMIIGNIKIVSGGCFFNMVFFMIKIIIIISFSITLLFICPYLEAKQKQFVAKINPPKNIKNTLTAENNTQKNTSSENRQTQSTITPKKKPPEQWIALKKELKNRRSSLTAPLVKRRLERIHRVMKQKNSENKTLKLISKLEKIVKNQHFELARLYKLKASVYLSKDDFENAFLYYNKALDLKTLPYKQHLSVLSDMASLNLRKNKIKKASYLVDQLFYLSDTIPASFYILKATILIERKQKKQALEMVMKALQSTTKPVESWLALAAGLNLEMEQYIPAMRFLTTLTSRWPKKQQYWKKLSATYLRINKDDRALATLDLAYKMDFLEKEQEILHLTSLLLRKGLALKAAHLMRHSIKLKKVKPSQKNYEILGECWETARETNEALKAYQLASSSAKDGKIFAKLGRIYKKNKNWKEMIKYLKKALRKGGIKRPADLYLQIGFAQVQLKTYHKAIKSFEQVINTKATVQTIKTARQLINYTQSLQHSTENTLKSDTTISDNVTIKH